MQFKRCAICGLHYPLSVMQPIQAKHNGKIVVVGICNICKKLKENEGKNNATNQTPL